MDHEVHELDVGLASRIVEHTESRIGVSYVVVATIIAAIVGAIAGALAGHFVH
jgi:ABC-type antimicrobial peptide transport system permease subunit